MVYFGGHSQELTKRMQNIRDRKRASKKEFKEKGQTHSVNNLQPEYKNLSEEELNQYKEEIRRKTKREKKKFFIVLTVTCLLVIAFFLFLGRFFQ